MRKNPNPLSSFWKEGRVLKRGRSVCLAHSQNLSRAASGPKRWELIVGGDQCEVDNVIKTLLDNFLSVSALRGCGIDGLWFRGFLFVGPWPSTYTSVDGGIVTRRYPREFGFEVPGFIVRGDDSGTAGIVRPTPRESGWWQLLGCVLVLVVPVAPDHKFRRRVLLGICNRP